MKRFLAILMIATMLGGQGNYAVVPEEGQAMENCGFFSELPQTEEVDTAEHLEDVLPVDENLPENQDEELVSEAVSDGAFGIKTFKEGDKYALYLGNEAKEENIIDSFQSWNDLSKNIDSIKKKNEYTIVLLEDVAEDTAMRIPSYYKSLNLKSFDTKKSLSFLKASKAIGVITIDNVDLSFDQNVSISNLTLDKGSLNSKKNITLSKALNRSTIHADGNLTVSNLTLEDDGDGICKLYAKATFKVTNLNVATNVAKFYTRQKTYNIKKELAGTTYLNVAGKVTIMEGGAPVEITVYKSKAELSANGGDANEDVPATIAGAPLSSGQVLVAPKATAGMFKLAAVNVNSAVEFNLLSEEGKNGYFLEKNGNNINCYYGDQVACVVLNGKTDGLTVAEYDVLGYFSTMSYARTAINALKDNTRVYTMLLLKDVGTETKYATVYVPTYCQEFVLEGYGEGRKIYSAKAIALKKPMTIRNLTYSTKGNISGAKLTFGKGSAMEFVKTATINVPSTVFEEGTEASPYRLDFNGTAKLGSIVGTTASGEPTYINISYPLGKLYMANITNAKVTVAPKNVTAKKWNTMKTATKIVASNRILSITKGFISDFSLSIVTTDTLQAVYDNKAGITDVTLTKSAGGVYVTPVAAGVQKAYVIKLEGSRGISEDSTAEGTTYYTDYATMLADIKTMNDKTIDYTAIILKDLGVTSSGKGVKSISLGLPTAAKSFRITSSNTPVERAATFEEIENAKPTTDPMLIKTIFFTNNLTLGCNTTIDNVGLIRAKNNNGTYTATTYTVNAGKWTFTEANIMFLKNLGEPQKVEIVTDSAGKIHTNCYRYEKMYVSVPVRVDLKAGGFLNFTKPVDTTVMPYITAPQSSYAIDTATAVGWQTSGGKAFYFGTDHKAYAGLWVIKDIFDKYVIYRFEAGGGLKKGGTGQGIDVSKWQGDINWSQVAASGKEFAIIRAGSTGYTKQKFSYSADSKAVENIINAKKAGVSVGLYYFSQATTPEEARVEAQVCLNVLSQAITSGKSQGVNVTLDYPIYFDSEWSSEKNHNGRADSLTKAQRTACAKAFCDTINSAGYEGGIYASKYWFTDNLEISQLAKYQIWVAQWANACTYTASKYGVWQYSDKGSVPGINGAVDLDISYLGR